MMQIIKLYYQYTDLLSKVVIQTNWEFLKGISSDGHVALFFSVRHPAELMGVNHEKKSVFDNLQLFRQGDAMPQVCDYLDTYLCYGEFFHLLRFK